MRKWIFRSVALFVGRKAWEMYQQRQGEGRGGPGYTTTGPGGGVPERRSRH
jgi:hypothetical protein